MATHYTDIKRRSMLKFLAGLSIPVNLWPTSLFAGNNHQIKRVIPSSKESLPVIGMGSWLTFDIGDDQAALNSRIQVLQHFFHHGGGVIDSSPMYGSSEYTIGQCLKHLNHHPGLFPATKVWSWGKSAGIEQMRRSQSLWGVNSFKLMQIHNMLDWEDQLETLKEWKSSGRIRYIGITTSHGRRHKELELALTSEAFDFVQFTYNVIDREVEKRLLPLAQERGIAVIINRPFRGGDCFELFKNKPLPTWVSEFDCQNWAQFFLKFIISHPAVTCAIPATSQAAHMDENMGAGIGRLPDNKMRSKMIQHLENI